MDQHFACQRKDALRESLLLFLRIGLVEPVLPKVVELVTGPERGRIAMSMPG
jgi:hypothetical protein